MRPCAERAGDGGVLKIHEGPEIGRTEEEVPPTSTHMAIGDRAEDMILVEFLRVHRELQDEKEELWGKAREGCRGRMWHGGG